MSQGFTRTFSHEPPSNCSALTETNAVAFAAFKSAAKSGRRQCAPGLQISKEAVNLGVTIEARQLFTDIVGQEIDFGGGHRFGVMHAVLEPVERGALGVVAHHRLRARRFAQGNAAAMPR